MAAPSTERSLIVKSAGAIKSQVPIHNCALFLLAPQTVLITWPVAHDRYKDFQRIFLKNASRR